jgi:hypothetical protein
MDSIRASHSLPPIVESAVSAVPAETKPKPTIESAAPLASASTTEGNVFRPEVGDEVLVAFEHGNPRAPYLTGGLWNASTPPTDAAPATGNEDKRLSEERDQILNHQLKNLK